MYGIAARGHRPSGVWEVNGVEGSRRAGWDRAVVPFGVEDGLIETLSDRPLTTSCWVSDPNQHRRRTTVHFRKLTIGDVVIAASGIVLFIAYFLPWFQIDFEGGMLMVNGEPSGFLAAELITRSGSDVEFLYGTFPMIIGLVLVGLVIVDKVFNGKLPKLPIRWGPIFLGGLVAVLVSAKLITGYHSLDRAFGLYIATLAAVGLAVGAFLRFLGADTDGLAVSNGSDG